MSKSYNLILLCLLSFVCLYFCVFTFLAICSCINLNLKLQSVSFTSLSRSMFENLELQLLAELSSLHGVVLWHSSSADESNVLR